MFRDLEKAIGSKVSSSEPLSGGSINETSLVITKDEQKFVVKKKPTFPDSFLKEYEGLEEIRSTQTIKVPNVINISKNFLILEYLEPTSKLDPSMHFTFGEELAKMHRISQNYFGYKNHNYIGSNLQKNIPNSSWAEFFFHQRIGFQRELLEKNKKLYEELRVGLDFLSKHYPEILVIEEPASLCHGDLWSGNFLFSENGEAYIFDPAVYYGHRETDIAMTKLFGGFSSKFYEGYENEWPLHKNYSFREPIYQLYHLLNHLNIFGTSYLPQCLEKINFYRKYFNDVSV